MLVASRRVAAALLVFAVLPAAAHAQDSTLTAAARELFTEGVEAADRQDWERAENRFTRALQLRSSPTIELNLAIVRRRTGRLVEASEGFRRVLRSEEATPQVRESAQRMLADVRTELAWVVLQTLGDREEVEFFSDDQVLPQVILGASIPLDPGVHRFEARRDGEVVAQSETDFAPGERRVVTLRLSESRGESANSSAPERVGTESSSALPAEFGSTGSRSQSGTRSQSSTRGPETTNLEATRLEPAALTTSESDDSLAIALGITGGIVVVGTIVGVVLGLTLSESQDPYLGNAGRIEIGQ